MGNSRLGYWRIANSPILAMAINNNCLRKAGYATLMASYLEWHPKYEPPYAEPHVRWCGRSVNAKVGEEKEPLLGGVLSGARRRIG